MRNVTQMIKSKGFNQIRKVLKPNGRKGTPSTLTKEQKFEQIELIINILSAELRNYKIGKKEKRKIAEERIKRGYKPKKKTTKEQYEQMKNNNLKTA